MIPIEFIETNPERFLDKILHVLRNTELDPNELRDFKILFKQIKEHLLTQNAKAIDSFGECKYLEDTTGYKCAVGCLISEEYYLEYLEGESTDSIIVLRAVEKSTGIGITDRLAFWLRAIQRLHDTLPVEYWEKSLDKIEKEFNL